MIQTRYLQTVTASDTKNRFQALREKYPIFKYDGFSISTRGDNIQITFRYSIPPDIEFDHNVVFENVPRRISDTVLNNLAFHLGLAEMLSYWKCTCSPNIEIAAGNLDREQIDWWKDLLIHGMGEYFYTNDINFTELDLVQLIAQRDETRTVPALYIGSLMDRALVQVSGGRDSALTLGMLRAADKPFNVLLVNPIEAAFAVAGIAGRSEPIAIRRTIDPSLLDLNSRGFLNGHIPFSACLAFISTLGLVLYDYHDIVVSNERSSNEGNLLYCGQEINHQYSKSLRFEILFNEYMQRYLVKEGSYFSFARPLCELQIGRAFSYYKEFFTAFRSCNRNMRKGTWCGECPKCLSVFITLYPFVERCDLLGIFGRDLFEEQSSIPILRTLTGAEGHKPFECVCTQDEANVAIRLSIESLNKRGLPLPQALKALNTQGTDKPASVESFLGSFGQHNMPHDYEELIKTAIAPFDEATRT